MSPLLASVLAGMLAFSLYGLATVLMKYGAEAIASPRTMLSTPAKTRQSAVWIAGCLVNLSFVAMLTLALGLGHASVVSSMTGFGLVVMATLSYFFLRERLGRIELAGMAVVVSGIALVGLSGAGGEAVRRGASIGGLLVYEGLMVAAAALGTAYALLLKREHAGFVLGLVAGVLGGASMLLQKVSIDPVMDLGLTGWSMVTELGTSLWVYAFIVVSMGSFVMLQVAYQFGQAVRVVPAMVSAMILVPILGGVMVFAETVGPAQLAGTALVVIGVVLLSAFDKPAAPLEEAAPDPGQLAG